MYKELSGVGRDSPESGSLYSDYESGHQYEQVSTLKILVFSTVQTLEEKGDLLVCHTSHARMI